jgi:ATP-binding cassette subfamily B protein
MAKQEPKPGPASPGPGAARPGKQLPPLGERLQAFRLIPRFLKLVWETRPLVAAILVFLHLLAAFGPLVMLWVAKLIVDLVVANIGNPDPPLERLAWLVVLELGLALLMDVVGRASMLLQSLLGDLFSNRMSVRLMEHAATLDLEHFEDPEFYDHLDRARRQTVGRIGLVSVLLGNAQSILTVAMISGALIAFNPWLFLLFILAMVPSFLGETRFARLSYSLLYSSTPERRQLDYLRIVASSDATAKEVKLFGLSDFFVRRYAELADVYYRRNRSLAVRRAVFGGALSAFNSLFYYVAYAYIVWQAVLGIITVGTLTFLTASFRRSRDMIQKIQMSSADVYEQCLFLRDLFTFLEMRPRIPAPPGGGRPVPVPIREGIRFEDVGFRYPGSDRWALRHVTFELRPGERMALVGENGAGKTTLVKLLTRLYSPTEGRVLLDGVDLQEYDFDTLRRAVGVIFQDFVRYDMTARENIAAGRIDALDDQARIEDAAGKSLASLVVGKLEHGYDQVLGRRFEGGVNLSGGEWQKVALARAYMRDAQILVLDEPTAALDARAEYEVFERFSELTEARMAVLISHRFSTVRMADRVLVIENGAIAESGSHEELLLLGGRYSELFQLQAAGYR